MSYTTLRGYELTPDHDTRRETLLPFTHYGDTYSRAVADGLARLRYAYDILDAEAALCEAEQRTRAETKERLRTLGAATPMPLTYA